jgi:glucose/arabinose dehydrogenase
MTLGANGTVFVGSMSADKVYALTSSADGTHADKVRIVAQGLRLPVGVAFRDGALYVSAVDRILRFDAIEAHLDDPPKAQVVTDKLPSASAHGWRFIAFGPDGKLYVPIGAPCNVCDKPGYAKLTRMNADGGGVEDVALGIRNTVGFDWQPGTGKLWFTDNGRDWLGDDAPSDELNRADRLREHFGFPYCHQGDLPDPEFGKGHACGDYTPPALKLGAHVAALGMRFYTGTQFPAEYRNSIFIAEHGSWNRSSKVGYRIVNVRVDGERAVEGTSFLSGWLRSGQSAWGRPADVLVMPDGALLVSDDLAGAIYRITWSKP